MTKHTPGPWEVSPFRSGDKEIKISCNSGEWARFDCKVDADDCCVDTAIANARLIAAAPELLAALNGIYDACLLADATGELGPWLDHRDMEMMKNALQKNEC